MNQSQANTIVDTFQEPSGIISKRSPGSPRRNWPEDLRRIKKASCQKYHDNKFLEKSIRGKIVL